jgi:PEP-CTERM motif
MIRGYSLITLLLMSSAAAAQNGIAVPEPTDFILFGLAVAGLIVGRRSSKAPPHDDNNDA